MMSFKLDVLSFSTNEPQCFEQYKQNVINIVDAYKV